MPCLPGSPATASTDEPRYRSAIKITLSTQPVGSNSQANLLDRAQLGWAGVGCVGGARSETEGEAGDWVGADRGRATELVHKLLSSIWIQSGRVGIQSNDQLNLSVLPPNPRGLLEERLWLGWIVYAGHQLGEAPCRGRAGPELSVQPRSARLASFTAPPPTAQPPSQPAKAHLTGKTPI